MKTFRIGIVGIGAIAEMHARAIADIDGAELVGGCCRTESKGLEFAKKFSCKFYPTCEELLEQEKRPMKGSGEYGSCVATHRGSPSRLR